MKKSRNERRKSKRTRRRRRRRRRWKRKKKRPCQRKIVRGTPNTANEEDEAGKRVNFGNSSSFARLGWIAESLYESLHLPTSAGEKKLSNFALNNKKTHGYFTHAREREAISGAWSYIQRAPLDFIAFSKAVRQRMSWYKSLFGQDVYSFELCPQITSPPLITYTSI